MVTKDGRINNILELQQKMTRRFFEYKTDRWMKVDLTIDQLKSLIFIYSNKNQRVSFKDLAGSLGISRSNITGLADRLIQNGLLTRNQDPEDRRIQYLLLTDKGAKILDDIKQEINKDATRILNTLNIEELAALEKGLSAFAESVDKDLMSQPRKI